MDLTAAYLKDIARTYQNYKSLAERALAQLPDDDLYRDFDAESNTIAVLVRHLTGNLRSRFTDLLTTDGEKPDRDRDGEFDLGRRPTRAEMMQAWESAWSTTFATIDALTSDDLTRSVTIGGKPLLVLESLDRHAAHAAYHVGQIVLLSKHFAGSRWTTLSIPKKRS